MTVVAGYPREVWTVRSGSVDEEGVHEATRGWLVKTDNPDDDHSVPISAVGVTPGDGHPNLLVPAVAHAVEAEHPEDDATVWLVTWTYKSIAQEDVNNDNPLTDAPEIEWDGSVYRRMAEKDINDEVVLNSAGHLYDPPVEVDDVQWTISITRNVWPVPTWVLSYQNAVNSDPIVIDGIPINPGLAKINSLRIGKIQQRNDIPFRVVSLGIQVRNDGWEEERLDAGWDEYIDAGDPDLGTKGITLEDGTKPSVPHPLIGGVAIQNPSPTNPSMTFKTYKLYRELAFASLAFI